MIGRQLVGLMLLLSACGGHAANPLAGVLPSGGTTDSVHVLPPFPLDADGDWNLQMSGDVQVRWENRQNFDLNDSVSDDDSLDFLRTHLYFDMYHKTGNRLYLGLIDAQASDYALDPLQTDRWDVYLLYADLKTRADSPWKLRLGRFELPQISEGRVWGRPPIDYYWFNLIPLFQGAMLDYTTEKTNAYLFFLQQLAPQRLEDGVVVSDHYHHLEDRYHYGFFGQYRPRPGTEIEAYALGLSDHTSDRTFPPSPSGEDGTIDDLDKFTIGAKLRAPLHTWEGGGTLGYCVEGAYQFGQLGNDTIGAYMLHGDLNYAWEHKWKPKVTLLGNLATGDSEVGDGEYNTFDPLFGASHYPYGVMDFVRLSNLREVALTGSVQPTEKVKLQTGLHQFWMDSDTDAWVSPIGYFYGRDPMGQSGNELGTEIDLTATYQPTKRVTVETGIAHFFGGEFPGGNGRQGDANFMFLQTVFKF